MTYIQESITETFWSEDGVGNDFFIETVDVWSSQ